MRWSPAPLTVFGSGSGRCRRDSFCKPAPGCATRRAEASRSPPLPWRCGPPHAGRSPASGRPLSWRSSLTGWSTARPRIARPVGNRPGGGRSGHHLLVASRPGPFRGCFRQARRCRAHRRVIRHGHAAPTEQVWRSTAQPRTAHDRAGPNASRLRHKGLRPASPRPGQDHPRHQAVPHWGSIGDAARYWA
jgi:hypothetical protein